MPKAVRTAFRSYERIRVDTIVHDDTGWPARGRSVLIGAEDRDGRAVLLQMNKRQAISIAKELLEQAT